MRLVDADITIKDLLKEAAHQATINHPENARGLKSAAEYLKRQPTAYDVDNELRLLKNYIRRMPKTYRQRNQNYVIVRDLLMDGTSTAGQTSCIMKCRDLGIDPYGYDLKGAVQNE